MSPVLLFFVFYWWGDWNTEGNDFSNSTLPLGGGAEIWIQGFWTPEAIPSLSFPTGLHPCSVNPQDLFFFLIFIYLAAPDLSWGMRDLYLQRVGSSSLTRDRTRAPCTGGTDPEPLDHQGSPPAKTASLDAGSDRDLLEPSSGGVPVFTPWGHYLPFSGLWLFNMQHRL